MADRPGFGGSTTTTPNLEFNWRPIDTRTGQPTDTRPVQPGVTDTTRISDRTAQPGQSGAIELSYADPDFDRKLWSGNYQTLRIKDFPPGVQISSWVDNNGFFMWYKNGADNRKPHYLPPGLKTIEVNGFTQNVDEMRIQASMASVKEQDRAQIGFTAVNGRTNPLEFAQRMGNLGMQELNNQEKWLRQAADASPNNPYFRIYLSDILLAQAFKPIMDQVNGGASRIDLNTPYTQQKINEALIEARRAQDITRQQGGARFPNLDMMPGLAPFALNPYAYNPDIYWSGAIYQGYQREMQLKALQFYLQRFSSVELPPALPPRR